MFVVTQERLMTSEAMARMSKASPALTHTSVTTSAQNHPRNRKMRSIPKSQTRRNFEMYQYVVNSKLFYSRKSSEKFADGHF